MSDQYKKFQKDLNITSTESITYSETSDMESTTIPTKAKKVVNIVNKTNWYDLIVIGGGSAGIATAVEASKYNKKIAVFDYVKPTPHNTKWGLGGTCVNVGCIPKKLFHHAANIGYTINNESQVYGWNGSTTKKKQHNWNVTVENIQNHIKSLNYGYKNELKSKNIESIAEASSKIKKR